jgi:hypothetical protein
MSRRLAARCAPAATLLNVASFARLDRLLLHVLAWGLAALALTACSTGGTSGQPDHGSSVQVTQNYAVAAKAIARAMQACLPQYVTTLRIVPELRSAYIAAQTKAAGDKKSETAALRVDVYEATANLANVNVYSGERGVSESLQTALIKAWLNEGSRSCRINGRPEGGPASF